ncbi:MAG: hypothetical protein WCY25_01655 [Moheibacter sp.]
MKPYREFDIAKAPNPIYKEQYLQELADISTEENRSKAESAFKKAWETRNFEIEMYWKRANYFWAFQIPVFTAYFLILNSIKYNEIKSYEYMICCIGIIVSSAWFLINKGSKSWQRHWEHHIDFLEDNFTGPLYKTVTKIETYSVSKINELVSLFFALIWVVLSISYLFLEELLCFSLQKPIAIRESFFTLITLFVLWQMFFQHGKGMFQKREIQFYRRETKITEQE